MYNLQLLYAIFSTNKILNSILHIIEYFEYFFNIRFDKLS